MVADDLRARDHRCSAPRRSPGIVLAIPVGTLTALAFAAPIAAYMSTQRDTTAFNAIWRFGITPLFLFSGTFFPIEPAARRRSSWIAWLLPLWHGVDLARALSLGTVGDAPLAAARPPRDPAGAAPIGRRHRDVRHVPPAARATIERLRRRPCACSPIRPRQPARVAAHRAQRVRLPDAAGWSSSAGFFEPLFYLLVDRARASAGWSATSRARTGRRSRTRCSSRPALLATRVDERRDRRVHVQRVLQAQLRRRRTTRCSRRRSGRATWPWARSAGRSSGRRCTRSGSWS